MEPGIKVGHWSPSHLHYMQFLSVIPTRHRCDILSYDVPLITVFVGKLLCRMENSMLLFVHYYEHGDGADI
jgi:hypothetical protein